MKKISIFLFGFLAACSVQQPQAIVTHSAQVTVTSSPPTATPIPTPTLHPQFAELQSQIAAGGETYTLNADGQIEMQTEQGMTIVPDILVYPDGTMTFTHNGQEFTVNPETLEINGQTITFKDTEDKIWVFDGKTLTREKIITELPIEKDPYKFRNCVIELNADGDAQPVIEYVKSLKKYHGADRYYDPSKLMFNKLINYGTEIFYDIAAPNYDDPASRPFERGVYCSIKFTTPEGKVIDYFTSFVQYYQPGLTPDKYPWLVFVARLALGADDFNVNAYTQDMYFPVIVDSAVSQSGFDGNDPLTEALTFSKFNDMDYRFKAATEGDMTRLDGELGIILETKIRRTDADTYK